KSVLLREQVAELRLPANAAVRRQSKTMCEQERLEGSLVSSADVAQGTRVTAIQEIHRRGAQAGNSVAKAPIFGDQEQAILGNDNKLVLGIRPRVAELKTGLLPVFLHIVRIAPLYEVDV